MAETIETQTGFADLGGGNPTPPDNTAEKPAGDKPEQQMNMEFLNQFFEQKMKTLMGEVDNTVDTKTSEKLKEYERLAKMSPAERKAYELEQKLKTYEEKEKTYQQQEAKAEALSQLKTTELSSELVDFINLEDKETIPQQIEKLNILINGMVEEKVQERIQTSKTNPFNKTKVNAYELTQDQFDALSLDEKMGIAATKPELFRKFTSNN